MLATLAGGLLAAPALAGNVQGIVSGRDGTPVVGAMVSFRHSDPSHTLTVFTDERGVYRATGLVAGGYDLRVRRIGWRDGRAPALAVPAAGGVSRDWTLERETDPEALAAQLPSNRWFALLLDEIKDEAQREEFVRQCTYCHQQGSLATRKQRDDEEWRKLLALMARMGGVLSPEVVAQVPELFRTAYDPATAVPALTASMHEPDFAPPPSPEVRRAVIEEWELGGAASMQHDLAVHPDGRIYSVDMMQDKLYRLDPATGEMATFPLPSSEGESALGGNQPLPPTANAHFGPHSLQVAPDGAIWTTLALDNKLGRFDVAAETWSLHSLPEGYYPHTLRFDAKGRIWYTLAISNHLGMYDPAADRFETVPLPTVGIGQAIAVRLVPVFLWLSRHFDLSAAGESGGGIVLPVPYGVDVAPDGMVWFSQLNQHRIGRIDPDTLQVEMVDTPFTAPRRLRFDSQGRLWIPGFSSNLISRFDPETREFRNWELPILPKGTETPYALHVDTRSDTVWICGTNSDTLIRFEPDRERFSVYPLPTRVTYTREIDFDAEGRVWTSNSNLPTWQVEGGFPRVIRLDPGAAGTTAALGAPVGL